MNKTNIVMIIIMRSQGKKGTIYSYSGQKGRRYFSHGKHSAVY